MLESSLATFGVMFEHMTAKYSYHGLSEAGGKDGDESTNSLGYIKLSLTTESRIYVGKAAVLPTTSSINSQ